MNLPSTRGESGIDMVAVFLGLDPVWVTGRARFRFRATVRSLDTGEARGCLELADLTLQVYDGVVARRRSRWLSCPRVGEVTVAHRSAAAFNAAVLDPRADSLPPRAGPTSPP